VRDYEAAVIWHGILGALAFLSLFLLLWQWLAARRFPLHQRCAGLPPGSVPCPAAWPAVTLLKPIKGCDEHTEACLRSWFAQDYAGEIQMLFAVAEANDPAVAVIEKLFREFPQREARLVVCPERLGANAKVSKLAQLEPLAKHEILVISDADVKVPADLLVNLVGPLTPSDEEREDPRTAESAARRVGLVNCFYQLANPTTLAMRLEAIAVNADFWTQVLQSRSLKPLDFALGAVMATTRRQLAAIGGFRALADCLADDYQLGHRLAKPGQRIELCPVVVECWDSPMTWGAVWRHQVRWARTIRVCQPLPYFFSLISNATLWPLLWLVAAPSILSLAVAAVAMLARVLTALDCQARLTQSWRHAPWCWLAPVKDLLQVAVWAAAFLGNSIEWRGERYRLRRDGTLARR
jgi:ceramide glucosyltransferase